MKTIVGNSFLGQPSEGRRIDFSPERVGNSEPNVVKQYDEHIGRVRRQPLRLLAPPHDGPLERCTRDTGAVHRGKRQHQAINGSILSLVRGNQWWADSGGAPSRQAQARNNATERTSHNYSLEGVGRVGFSVGSPPSTL